MVAFDGVRYGAWIARGIGPGPDLYGVEFRGLELGSVDFPSSIEDGRGRSSPVWSSAACECGCVFREEEKIFRTTTEGEKQQRREREEERKSETFCDNDNDDGGAKTNGSQRNPLKGQHTRVCVCVCVRACVRE